MGGDGLWDFGCLCLYSILNYHQGQWWIQDFLRAPTVYPLIKHSSALPNDKRFISLHIRSMWETICDAWACWSGWNFGPNPTEYPCSVVTWYRILPPPKMKIVRESKSECPRIPPQMKIVRESKSKCPRIPPQNKNCQRVQIRVSQNTPQMKIVRDSKSECPRIPPQNENCQRFQIRVSQNTPPKNPNFQLSFLSPNLRVIEYPPPPTKKSKLPTFLPKSKSEGSRIAPLQNWKTGRSYVETNL